jgi:hypothetical protein
MDLMTNTAQAGPKLLCTLLLVTSIAALTACDAARGEAGLAAALTDTAEPAAAPAGPGAAQGAATDLVPALPPDAPLAPFQSELLDLAFDAASSLPLDPHVKNRSRAQDEVVTASLALDQPRRALDQAGSIANWRRGSACADVALYLIRRGETASAEWPMQLAQRVADMPVDPNDQEWRRDRVRAKLAAAYILLRQEDRVAGLEAELEPSEAARLVEARAAVGGPDVVDAQIAALDEAVTAGTFELVRHTMDACVQLVDRHYDDGETRARLEQAVRDTWAKVPRTVSVDLQFRLAEAALDHDDRASARRWIADAEQLIDSSNVLLEDQVQVAARLAVLLGRAGDGTRARERADAAFAAYMAGTETIADMFRAGALRPLAEAYHALGDRDAALSVYKLAVEEGALNPNARPRAMDLSATCLSLAQSACEPDAELRERLAEMRAGLGSPW